MLAKPFLIAILSILAYSTAFCCSCHSDIDEMNIARYNDAEAIFIGTVDSLGDCANGRTIRFIPKKIYKGIPGEKITIEGIDCKSSCAMTFEKELEYLIYVYRDIDQKLRIYPCTGTRRLISKAEIEEELKHSEKFNTLHYIKREIEVWEHELEFLEKLPAVKDGKIKTYYPNGQLTGEGKFENGIPTGEWKYYYPDGNIKATGHYTHGKKSGMWVEHSTYYATYEDTIGSVRKKYLLKNSGTYDKGFKEGKWQRVNLDGSIQSLYYRKGKFFSDKHP